VQLFDAALDALFGILAGHRVAGQRGSCGGRGRCRSLRGGRLRQGETGHSQESGHGRGCETVRPDRFHRRVSEIRSDYRWCVTQ
jgi:hypothetical protein